MWPIRSSRTHAYMERQRQPRMGSRSRKLGRPAGGRATAPMRALLELAALGCGLLLAGCTAHPEAYSPTVNPVSPTFQAAPTEANKDHYQLSDSRSSIDGDDQIYATGTLQKRGARKATCDRRNVVTVGMTAAEVFASCWGRPTSITTSQMGPSKFELFVYQGSDYLYLENGVVKSVQALSQ